MADITFEVVVDCLDFLPDTDAYPHPILHRWHSEDNHPVLDAHALLDDNETGRVGTGLRSPLAIICYCNGSTFYD